jgi:hypothetical protein
MATPEFSRGADGPTPGITVRQSQQWLTEGFSYSPLFCHFYATFPPRSE